MPCITRLVPTMGLSLRYFFKNILLQCTLYIKTMVESVQYGTFGTITTEKIKAISFIGL